LRVIDDGFDLAAMTDDPRVVEQPRDVAFGVARHTVEIEAMKGRAEVLALVEDGEPAQTRLKTLETQLLEQAAIVVDGESPFGIVITLVFGRGRAPRTAHFAVGPGDGSAHANGALCQSRFELSGRFETDV